MTANGTFPELKDTIYRNYALNISKNLHPVTAEHNLLLFKTVLDNNSEHIVQYLYRWTISIVYKFVFYKIITENPYYTLCWQF